MRDRESDSRLQLTFARRDEPIPGAGTRRARPSGSPRSMRQVPPEQLGS